MTPQPPLPARHLLAMALASAMVCSPALAAEDEVAAPPTQLQTVEVTASPLRGSAEALARPVEVLYGDELEDRKSGNLGDTVSKLPGVQSATFGTGVGRPIIRGQEGPRVQVLSGGIGSMDASTVSADHAVSIEPFLADQIEVLKGPANLLFGSGAIGGAVNVVDGRLAESIPDDPFGGRVELRGNTVNHERSGAFRLDGVNGNWVIHLDGLVRDGDDYDIPGYARLEQDDHDHGDEHDHEEAEQVRGRLPNSAVKTRAGAVGATWLGERGHFGVAVSTYRTNYGIPDGAHVHADDGHGHGHGDEDDHDHDHDHDHDEVAHEDGHDHEEHGPVRIDMVQNRIDMKAGIYDPVPFLSALNLRAARNDYEHVELEGGVAATRFANRGHEARLEAVQQTFHGWRGAFGLQLGRTDFSAVGEEAFVPSTRTDTLGLFAVQEKDFGPFKLELGARHERVDLEPVGVASRDFDATSLSGAAIWRVNGAVDLRLGLDQSERAPTNEELFANGAHIATQSIEIGDPDLDTEHARRVELGLHAHVERLDLKLAVYQTDFNDFIYLAETGVAESLPVRLWTQADAKFRGAEAEARIRLSDSDAGLWNLRLFGDYVRAKLDGEGYRHVHFDVPHGDHAHHYHADLALQGNLPRIAPARFGADLDWALGGWRASVGAVRYARQDDVAEHEDPSAAYTLIDANVAYRWDREDCSWEVFLNGNNLADKEVRPHTSLLRDYSPLPGRAVAFGVRLYF